MLKAEQIPDAVIDAAVAMRDRGGSMSDIIAAALNAWPEMVERFFPNDPTREPGIFLPLPRETVA